MAFWKDALETVGGFDPQFRVAGDDVDICWRLQEYGLKLRFAPNGSGVEVLPALANRRRP
jgi:GT2 family glycosyltransferase